MQTTDLDELKALVAELRAEHVAQKEKDRRERWTRYVSLSMVVVAVLSAIASLKGGGFSSHNLTEMNVATFNQTQASDQWAFYQSSSIKGNLYEMEFDRLSSTPAPDTSAIAKVKAKMDKYDKNKAEALAKAKEFEDAREAARKRADSAALHGKEMGLAITVFQVAIALGAMCLIVKKKPLWFASMALSALAVSQMIYVLFFMPN
jgi:hypothetical protein